MFGWASVTRMEKSAISFHESIQAMYFHESRSQQLSHEQHVCLMYSPDCLIMCRSMWSEMDIGMKWVEQWALKRSVGQKKAKRKHRKCHQKEETELRSLVKSRARRMSTSPALLAASANYSQCTKAVGGGGERAIVRKKTNLFF